LTSIEEKQRQNLETEKQKQNIETDTDSLKRFNESESVSSDLTPEEQSEKPRKLTRMQKDKIAEYKREENVFYDTRQKRFVKPADWRIPTYAPANYALHLLIRTKGNGASEKKAGEEELTVDAGRGPDNSTVAAPSNMETVVHGAGGKFGLELLA